MVSSSVGNFRASQKQLNGPVERSMGDEVHSAPKVFRLVSITSEVSSSSVKLTSRSPILPTHGAGKNIGVGRNNCPRKPSTLSSRKTRKATVENFGGQRTLYRYKGLQLSHSRCKQRQRVVRMLIFIVLTFAMLNLPHHAGKLFLNYSPSSHLASDFDNLVPSLTFALMYTNCALNPILYAFMSKSFRASLRDFCFGSRRSVARV